MRLNDIKQEPLKIISYIIMTLLLSYFTVGDIMISITLTVLSMWFCMMPRLTYENSFYKNKMPKFLFKFDLINKLISILIPLIFATVLIVQSASKGLWTESPLKSILIIGCPLFVSIVHNLIYSKYEKEADWLMPIIASFITIFGTEFITGNLGNYIKNLFPFVFGNKVTDIYVLWTFLMQFFIVYGIFRVLSIVLPARGFAMSVTSLLCFALAFLNRMCEMSTGMPFRVMEFLDIKRIIAFIKMIVVENYDVLFIIKCIAIFAIIVILAYTFSKKSSPYEIHTRFKSFLCGVGVLCLAVFMTVIVFRTTLCDVPNCEKQYGIIYYTANTTAEKNTYSEEFESKLKIEIDKLFPPEEEKKPTENTEDANATESTANTTSESETKQKNQNDAK